MPAAPEQEIVMRWSGLIAALLTGGCAGSGSLDARMKPMVGADEPVLVAAMGRAPDSDIRTVLGTRLLQWRWQKEYAIPDRMLGYSYAGGVIRPIPHTTTGTVRDACVAEWTIENGIATHYRWEGSDCAAATAELSGRPGFE
jgi:hypothetical protein